MKNKLIIVEGAIGSGKSSLAHNLRETMSHTTMFSLSSIENDNEFTNYQYHADILNMILGGRNLKSNFILCRSFISNEVYARLNKKDYDNNRNFRILTNKLELLQYYYDVHVIILASNPNEYERRLGKRNKFELIEHNVKEALAQQREYLLLADELRNAHVDVRVYNNSGMSKDDLTKLVMTDLGLK